MVDTSRKYIISRLIRLIAIIGTLALILFILQVTVGVVNWDLIDYAAACALLFVAGAGIQLILLKISKPTYRVVACMILSVIFVLIWVELAVGIF